MSACPAHPGPPVTVHDPEYPDLSHLPSSDFDLFDEEHLDYPYPGYAEIRETGPAVHMTRLGAVALTRAEQVRAAADDWEAFSSARGVTLNPNVNAAISGQAIVATDPPYHDDLRKVLNVRLAPRQVRKLSGEVDSLVRPLVEKAVAKREFDIINDLAYIMVPQFVLDRFGFPEEGSEHLLEWAEGVFMAFAPNNNPRAKASVPKVEKLFGWLGTACTRDAVKPGGYADALYLAAEAGDIKAESVVPNMSQYAIPGIDTTIGLLGNIIEDFARNPEQYDLVRSDPAEHLRPALTEALRLDTPVQWFTRHTTRDWETEGHVIPAGTWVMLMYGAANRDPRLFPDPDKFDVKRDAMNHLAFGSGVHGCPGQHLALLQVSGLVQALIDAGVTKFELTSEPERTRSNATRAFLHLPVRVTVEG